MTWLLRTHGRHHQIHNLLYIGSCSLHLLGDVAQEGVEVLLPVVCSDVGRSLGPRLPVEVDEILFLGDGCPGNTKGTVLEKQQCLKNEEFRKMDNNVAQNLILPVQVDSILSDVMPKSKFYGQKHLDGRRISSALITNQKERIMEPSSFL